MKKLLIPLIVLLVISFISASTSEWRDAAALERKAGKERIKVKTVRSSEGKSIFIYSVPDIQIQKLDSASVSVELGNAVMQAREGEPIMPVIPVDYIVPAGTTIEKIEITGLTKITVPGKHAVEYGKAVYPLMPGVKIRSVVPKASINGSDNAFPEKQYELVTIQRKHGVNIAVIKINPVIYHPQSGRLFYYKEMQLEITTVSAKKKTNEKVRCFPSRLNPSETGVENPEALEGYFEESGGGTKLGICNPADSYAYVIVTTAVLRDATTDVTVRDLITRRKSQGLTATIVVMEDILTSYTGVDNAEKLRNFIIDAYTNWETDYVLLGGDITAVPMRKLLDEEEIPSDLYFQCLDGTYNSDNDSYWGETTDGEGGGEVDLLSEVSVGRASAENAAEMSNFIYKTLKYETGPEASSYLHTALMCVEHLGFCGVSEYATAIMEEIRLGASTYGYTTVGFISSPSITVDTLYDASGYDWPKAEIISRINSNKYSIINHLGYANTDNVMKFNNADADNLTNDNPLFVYSQGCYPGNFEGDCIAEHLTTSTRKGLYGGIMNSRYGWGAGNSTDGPSQRFDRQFWDAYFGEYMFTLGKINADSHEDNLWGISDSYIRWCYFETNLFGDPYTFMRGRITGPFVSYNSHTIPDNLGKGSGIVEPGEQIKIPVTLENNGSEAANGVVAQLASPDPDGSVVSNQALLTVIKKNNFQMFPIAVGASGATAVTSPRFTAESIMAGSNANGVVQGSKFKLFLK